MVNYRRSFAPGGSFFLTVTLRDRRSHLLFQKALLLKQSCSIVKSELPFKTQAYVILPDHFHVIWKLPDGDSDYSSRVAQIKKIFTNLLVKERVHLHKNSRNEYCIWQSRFWEHTIRDEADYENHVNYIHYNPIKHNLVNNLHKWPHSSFHHYVQTKKLPPTWKESICPKLDNINFGE